MTDHIQVGNVLPRVQYVANGVQSAFVYPFPAFAAEDLEVYVGTSRQAGTYSVSGVGVSVGGSVLFAAPPPAGALVTLRRRLAIQRTTDFQADGVIRAKTINDELDYQTAAIQQVGEEAGRAVKRAVTSSSVADLTLPEPQAGRALKWNAGGDGLENTAADADQMATIATQKAAEAAASAADAADARTAAGVSATGAAGSAQAASTAATAAAVSAAAVAGVVSGAGLLQATNNLSDLGSAAAARTNLGLGSAAAASLDSDTAMAADSDARVASQKAVRAYVAANAAPSARLDLIEGDLGLLFLGLARLTSSTAPEQGGQEVADEFDDATGIGTLGGATWSSGSLANPVLRLSGTPTMPLGGVAANINDNNPATAATSSTLGNLTGAAVAARLIAKLDLGASLAISRLEAVGIAVSPATGGAIQFYASVDDATWTQVGSNQSINGSAATVAVSGSVTARYVAIALVADTWTGHTVTLADFNAYGNPAGIATVSAAYAAASVPATATLVAIWKDVCGAAVVNTDLVLKASRDGGTSWTAVAMADFGPGPVASSRVLKGSADLSGQPSGTAMKWRAETANGKEQQLHGIWMQWR